MSTFLIVIIAEVADVSSLTFYIWVNSKRQEGREAVLIDDSETNCREWRSVGGIAVHHTSLHDTLHQLHALGFVLSSHS